MGLFNSGCRKSSAWMSGYTNITSLALLTTCLGGDLLDDSSLRSHGLEKFRTWVTFTSKNGHVLEFNSPTYAAVTMRSLATIRDDVKCPETASLAEIMLCRLGLSYVLHLHKATGRLPVHMPERINPVSQAQRHPRLSSSRAG